MSVLERTREIGVLRCIGARARDIRRIFTAEGIAVSLAGWLLGIPVGYALARMFNWLLLEVVGIDFGFTFPPLNLLIALVGTVAARAADHAAPAPARRPVQAGRGDPLCVSHAMRTQPRVQERVAAVRRRDRRVVAAHAAVDSFIAPEPGTGPGDHLARGLVTLALLGLAAAAYPRLRAGARAAVAATLGVLALEGAVLAVRDARAAGARGEDWTGFLLGPVGAGAARARVPSCSGARASRAGCAGPAAAGSRSHRRRGVSGSSCRSRSRSSPPTAPAPTSTPVALGRPYEQVTVRTSDGLDLAGWYVRSRNGAAVISYPTRKGKLPQARMLVRHGYGVLLLDARGYDGSQGDPNLFGWDDTKDIDAAVAWLQRQPDVRNGRVGGIGFSVGGEMMLQAAAANTGLRAVVSDGAGFRSVREELLYGPRGWFTSLPEQAVQSAALTVMSGTTPPPSLEGPRATDRAAARLLHLRRPRRRRRGIQPRLLRRRRSAEGDLEDPRGRATPAATRRDRASTSNASSASSTAPCSPPTACWA